MVKYVSRGFVAPDAIQKGKQNLLAVHKLISPCLTKSLLHLQSAEVVRQVHAVILLKEEMFSLHATG